MDAGEVATILKFYQSRGQEGSGMNYFYTPYSTQRGSGIGSYLSGAFRPLIPIVLKSSSYLRPHVKKTLSNIGDDLAESPSFSKLKTSLKRRGISGMRSIAEDLCSKMKGGHYRQRRKAVSKAPAVRKTIKRRAVKKKATVKRKSPARKKPSSIEFPLFK